MKEDISEV